MAKNFEPCSGCAVNKPKLNEKNSLWECSFCGNHLNEKPKNTGSGNVAIVTGDKNIVIQSNISTKGDFHLGDNIVIINGKRYD